MFNSESEPQTQIFILSIQLCFPLLVYLFFDLFHTAWKQEGGVKGNPPHVIQHNHFRQLRPVRLHCGREGGMSPTYSDLCDLCLSEVLTFSKGRRHNLEMVSNILLFLLPFIRLPVYALFIYMFKVPTTIKVESSWIVLQI